MNAVTIIVRTGAVLNLDQNGSFSSVKKYKTRFLKCIYRKLMGVKVHSCASYNTILLGNSIILVSDKTFRSYLC